MCLLISWSSFSFPALPLATNPGAGLLLYNFVQGPNGHLNFLGSRDSRSTSHMLGNTKTLTLKMSSYSSFLEPEIRGKLSFQPYFISEDPSTSHPSQGPFSAVLQGVTASITSLCQATLDEITIFKNISAKYSIRQQGYTGRDFVIWGPKKSCF